MGKEDRQLLNMVKERYIRQAAYDDNSYEKTLQTNNTLKMNRIPYNEGIKWFEQGFALEEAPEKFRSDFRFIEGYKYGKIKEKGRQYFLEGIPFKEIQDEDKRSRAFREGYREAMTEANNIKNQNKQSR